MSDLIDRQDAIDAHCELCEDRGRCNCDICPDVEVFQLLPSVTPKTEQRWIPCSERLPEEPFGCLVTVWDTNPVTMDEFENILPYFVGWDGEQWNDADGEQCPFEVIAWCELPEPYREEGEE